jgi:hypothetical protein
MITSITDVMDTYEAAAREAVLRGDGSVVDRTLLCFHCAGYSSAVWFGSRGWVCVSCENVVPADPPTPEQRMANQPNREATDYMFDVMNAKLGDVVPIPFASIHKPR